MPKSFAVEFGWCGFGRISGEPQNAGGGSPLSAYCFMSFARWVVSMPLSGW